MTLRKHLWKVVIIGLGLAVLLAANSFAQDVPKPAEGDFVVHDFHFKSGEVLPTLNLHYATYGKPAYDANGRVTNAVMVLHGTGGSEQQFVRPQFAGVLFGPGQLLDSSKYFIILPDSIGHGKSSKPSDGLHAKFPHYDYDDMVAAQHQLLTEGLKVNHLRLLMGTSMGCMHSWVWLETYPDFMDAAMPLACLPVQIAGRNRMMRRMAMDAIRNDPAWANGEYKQQPPGLRNALEMLLIMGSSPLQMQKNYPTRNAADAYLEQFLTNGMQHYDANDFLYQFDSSRDYDPSAKLETITAPVMFVNSADDYINPPELGIAEREIKRVKRGKFVLLPITDETRGHGTHTLAAIWQKYLAELMGESGAVSSRAQENVPEPRLVELSNPVYPPLARQANVTGEVLVKVTIAENGLTNSEALSGHPMLKEAALVSARESKFKGCTECSYFLRYHFKQSNDGDCCSAMSLTPNVTQGSSYTTNEGRKETDVTILAQHTCLCDPASTVTRKTRSWKCSYLWKCSTSTK